MASLGATDEELLKLAAIYWFTIEFGLCLQPDGQRKAYGAGILGGLGELEYCLTDKPSFIPLDLREIAERHLNFTVNAMQPYYFVAESFGRAKEQVREYVSQMPKRFNLTYDPVEGTVNADRHLVLNRPE